MSDNDFNILKASYMESFVHCCGHDEVKIVQDNVSYIKCVFSAIRAFSMNWPYTCFAGIGNHLVIANAFEDYILHRICIYEGEEFFQICDTFISDTKDLYVMILQNSTYILYRLDLDKFNTKGKTNKEFY